MGITDLFADFVSSWAVQDVHADAPQEEPEDDQKQDDGEEKQEGGEDGGEEESGEEPEEEEEEEEEPEDPKPKFEEECANTVCSHQKHHYDECVERVTKQQEHAEGHKGPHEDCVEEFFHLTHCATQCAAPKLFATLK